MNRGKLGINTLSYRLNRHTTSCIHTGTTVADSHIDSRKFSSNHTHSRVTLDHYRSSIIHSSTPIGIRNFPISNSLPTSAFSKMQSDSLKNRDLISTVAAGTGLFALGMWIGRRSAHNAADHILSQLFGGILNRDPVSDAGLGANNNQQEVLESPKNSPTAAQLSPLPTAQLKGQLSSDYSSKKV
jgi:hypothetical protein